MRFKGTSKLNFDEHGEYRQVHVAGEGGNPDTVFTIRWNGERWMKGEPAFTFAFKQFMDQLIIQRQTVIEQIYIDLKVVDALDCVTAS
jgi:hypothetical protein